MTGPSLPPLVIREDDPPGTRPSGDTVRSTPPTALDAVREEVTRALGQPTVPLTPELRLGDDLDIDSVMLIEMKCGLERRYPELAYVSLADVFLDCVTIGDLADRIADLAGPPVC